MALVCEIKGVDEAIKALQEQSLKHFRRLTIGLKRAGLYLQRESMKIVPVDTGALRGSAFTEASDEDTEDVVVRVGYTMNYALYVHENLDAGHKPGKVAKFLETPAYEGIPRMVDIIKGALV